MRIINNVIVKGGSNIKYYDVSNIQDENLMTFLQQISLLKKQKNEEQQYTIGPMPFIVGNTYIAVGIDFELKVIVPNLNDYITVQELLNNYNFYEDIINLPEITEEEFYNLNV